MQLMRIKQATAEEAPLTKSGRSAHRGHVYQPWAFKVHCTYTVAMHGCYETLGLVQQAIKGLHHSNFAAVHTSRSSMTAHIPGTSSLK